MNVIPFASRLAVLALVAISAVITAVSPAAASADENSWQVGFVKTCPDLTCTGYLVNEKGQPIPGSSYTFSVTSYSFAGSILSFSATEGISSPRGSLTMSVTGTLDYGVQPNLAVVNGYVTGGTWKGEELTGARIHEIGYRVSGVTFAGTLQVFSG